jgi:enoyl-CoA hydratase/carnithine racemase
MSPQQNDTVLYRKEGKVGIITLNRPARYNAINQDLQSGLLYVLNTIQNDDTVQAVILTGEGKGFCAGADLMDFSKKITTKEVRDNLIMIYGNIVRSITRLEKPVICAINGPVAGAGLGFALACDLRIMADHASMRYAFINIGLVSDAGSTWFLAKQVGYSKALELIIDGEKIPAEECHQLGLTNKICPGTELMEKAMAWANRLAERPTLAIGATKKILHHAMDNGLISTIAMEAEQQMACLESQDHKEGVMAFLQKRKPNFIGK